MNKTFTECYTTLNVVYLHVPGCEVKPRPDLETTHQAGCFGIWNFFISPGEALLIWTVAIQL